MYANDEKNGEGTATARRITPAVDIYERPEDLVFLADLPGARPDEVKIEVDDGVLTISAPRRRSGKSADADQAEYHRAFTLGEGLDVARISASMRDGTLELLLPKTQRAKPRKVDVKPA